jgi:hypothetical protein
MKAHRELRLRLLFTLGPGRCTFWTCDLTYNGKTGVASFAFQRASSG